jgi:hypothetical protein
MDFQGIFAIGFAIIVGLCALGLVVAPLIGWRVTARCEETVSLRSRDLGRQAIGDFFREQGWRTIHEDANSIVARTSMTWRSWGEVVRVDFEPSRAVIRSECALSRQAIDYGRNRMNVQQIITALRRANA